MLQLTDDVSKIKGIGPRKSEQLGKLGIRTVEDLLDYIPVRYQDRRTVIESNHLIEGQDQLAVGTLLRKTIRSYGRNRTLLTCTFADAKGEFCALFFNMPFLARNLKQGQRYTLFGKYRYNRGMKTFNTPELHPEGDAQDFRGILPVYRLTAGITSRDISRWMRYVLESTDFGQEWLPESILVKRKICTAAFSYRNLHFPTSEKDYRVARSRNIYEKLFLHQLIIQEMRHRLANNAGDSSIPPVDLATFLQILPFELTEGQKQTVREIQKDLADPKPMSRLIQGDVGCGKTVVSECAMYQVASQGGQCVLMVPTEILARQHYQKISSDFEKLGISCTMLISALRVPEKRQVLARIEDGSVAVIIGTHAVIQNSVHFHNLELVVTDEQHRFGVLQRRMLAEKSRIPNVLVMSATPIPRTLAATVYGDMDFSLIRTSPASRRKIITRTIPKSLRAKAYADIRREVESGNRAYVVAPAIEEGDTEMASAETIFRDVRKAFRSYGVSLIHGRMDPSEKERIMMQFANGEVQVLVSTVVIEVGIDVPEATVMVIENADRFGLAQLHQLRGRVGRSDRQSYCWLVNYSDAESAAERLRILQETSDGFVISEEDYRLRGAGDIHGTMQHGAVNIFAELYRYENILNYVKEDIEDISEEENISISPETERRMKRFLREDYEDTI